MIFLIVTAISPVVKDRVLFVKEIVVQVNNLSDVRPTHSLLRSNDQSHSKSAEDGLRIVDAFGQAISNIQVGLNFLK